MTHRTCILMLALSTVVRLNAQSDTVPTAQHQDSLAADDPYKAGAGMRLAHSAMGEVRFKLYTYVRYLDQKGLESDYTNAFGRTSELDRRSDLLLNKMNIQFLGWLADKRFRYLAYVWTNNTAQGLGAQVVVGGNLTYRLSDHFVFGSGINALPGVRSTEGNFPNWLPVDNRLITEEYFRPSYTMGVWVSGMLAKGMDYQVMLGNNLSQLGVDAGQLDEDMNTVAVCLGWNPTTGEFGKPDAFGDFDPHDKVATRIGMHYTTSDEDRQSQPGTQSPENVQLRLSDGSVIFTPTLFGDGIVVEKARYQMMSADIGAKYKGFSVDAAVYARLIGNLRGTALDQLPASSFTDDGFQMQVSAMVVPRFVQLYAGYGYINGEYGYPWEMRGGLNLYPNRSLLFRLNVEYIHTERSPVGALSLPYAVGGTGGILNVNFVVNL